jgi:cytochrome c-type biogenesis protein
VTALTAAFIAGVLAAFNPCGFALLPNWAAWLIADHSTSDDLLARLLRALWAGTLATVAFLALFGTAGLLFSAGFALLGDALAIVGIAIGLLLAGLGALLLVNGHAPGLRIARTNRRGKDTRAVLTFGLAYGLTSLSCVLPAFVLTVGIAAGEPTNTRLLSFAGFALGMGAVLTVIALAAAATSETLTISPALLRLVPRIAGAVALAAAVVILGRELQLAAIALDREPPSPLTAHGLAALATALLAALALTSQRHQQGPRDSPKA